THTHTHTHTHNCDVSKLLYYKRYVSGKRNFWLPHFLVPDLTITPCHVERPAKGPLMRVTLGNRPALVAMALGDFPTDAAAGVMSPGGFRYSLRRTA
ncbi:hypothetical protein, partial [Coprobacter tertius]